VPKNPGSVAASQRHIVSDNLASVPDIDGVVVVTHPRNALEVVNQCGQPGVRRVWFHRAFGAGSVSGDAVHSCTALGIKCILGGSCIAGRTLDIAVCAGC
jgi:predicted CoA-binding protein